MTTCRHDKVPLQIEEFMVGWRCTLCSRLKVTLERPQWMRKTSAG